MPAYTLTNTYFATGEGMTHWLMYMYAENEERVLEEFKRREDPYFAIGAEIKEGFDYECAHAEQLLPMLVKMQMQEGGGNFVYFAKFHANYS